MQPIWQDEFSAADIKQSILENLQGCMKFGPEENSPRMRMVPESLCQEIEQILAFDELVPFRSGEMH